VIDSLAAGGDGVGRASDGRVIFVPMTAPGDRVRVALYERRSRFARGRLVELIDAGADLLAVVSDLFDADDVAARARAYARLFDLESVIPS